MLLLSAFLVLADDRQGNTPGGGVGIGLILGALALVVLSVALAWLLLVRRTRRERTTRGTHREGPGRS